MVPRRPNCATCGKLLTPLPAETLGRLEEWSAETIGGLDLEQALVRATEALIGLTRADRSSVLVPTGRAAMRVLASSEPARQGDVIISLDRYPELMFLLENQEPILVADTATHELLRPVRDLMRQSGITSIAAVPFHLAGMVAVLRMISRSRRFTPADLHILAAAAHVAEHRLDLLTTRRSDDASWRELTLAQVDAVVETRMDGRVVEVHGPIRERLGIGPEEVIGLYLDELFEELRTDQAQRRFLRLVTGRTAAENQVLCLSRGQRAVQRVMVWGCRLPGPGLRSRFAIRRIDGGSLIGETLFEQIPVPLLVVERPGGTITAVNHAAVQLIGLPTSELIGATQERILSTTTDPARVHPAVGRSIAVRVLPSTMLPEGGHETLLALVDLRLGASDLHREAQMRATLRRQLEEIENLENRLDELETIRTQFLATSAHELKTPITVIQSYLEILLADLADGLTEEQLSFLQITYESVMRLRQLVIDMVDLAALEGGKMQLDIERVEVAPVLGTVLDEMRPLATRSGVRLHQERLDHLPAMRADGSRIHQVLRNLIDNAIKSTPSGGMILLDGHAQADSVVLEVADTGEGIPAAKLTTIFDEFTQVDPGRDRSRQGSGLGLTICRRIMQAMGGRITVSSIEGRGARFSIQVPQWPEQTPKQTPKPDAGARPQEPSSGDPPAR